MAGPRYAQPPIHVLDQGMVRQFLSIKSVLDHICDRSDYGQITLSELALEVAYVNKVVHGLGVTPVGWRVTAQSAPALIYEDEISSDAVHLCLLVSGDVTIDLEVW